MTHIKYFHIVTVANMLVCLLLWSVEMSLMSAELVLLCFLSQHCYLANSPQISGFTGFL